MNIPTDTLDNWLNELKPYQRNIINNLLIAQDNNVENVAEKWLTTTGSPNIVSFGGEIKDSKPFWDNFKKEFYYFLCDETKYVEIKKSLKEESSIVKTMLVSSISSVIGATLGLNAALLTPTIVLMLYATSKIGVSAYCKTYI